MQTQGSLQNDFYPFYALIAYFWATNEKKHEKDVLDDIYEIMKLLVTKKIIMQYYSKKEIYKKFQKLKTLRIIEDKQGSIFYFLSTELREKLNKKIDPISFLSEDPKTQEIIQNVFELVSGNHSSIRV